MSPLPLTRRRLLPVRQLPSLWLQRHRWCHSSDVALRDYDCRRRRRRGHHLSCGCEQPIKAVHIIQAGQYNYYLQRYRPSLTGCFVHSYQGRDQTDKRNN